MVASEANEPFNWREPMTVEHHPLIAEFPEYKDQIHELKTHDAHFRKLFDEYHEIDKAVYRMDENIDPRSDEEMEKAKYQRLHLKDQLLSMLKAAG